ncbi:MAG: hypothetical protein ACREUZ_15850, partial [Burkholderiales bacterium]
YVLPPGVPAERLAALRAGFDAMVKDKAVQADFAKSKNELQPTSGAGVQDLVNRIHGTPKHIVEKGLKAIAVAKR